MPRTISCLLSILATTTVLADLPPHDPERVRQEHAAIVDAFGRGDPVSLRRLLRDVSFYGKPAAAMCLARLNATEALPEIRALNDQYARFPCSSTGDFGVAVILLEEQGWKAEKQRLLEIATSDTRAGQWPASVIDRAGRELAIYGGNQVIRSLQGVRTYGAQYTVLYLTTRSLPTSQIVDRCINQLSNHETPPKAEAAEDILIGLGPVASDKVRSLRAVMQERLAAAGTHSIAQTIVNRCNSILATHERQAATHRQIPIVPRGT